MKETFFSIFQGAIEIINQAMYVIVGVALIGFMWGIVRMLFSKDNAIAKKEGRSFMIYGLLVLFVMTSVWGLVNILKSTLPSSYIGDINSYSEEPPVDPSFENRFEGTDGLLDSNADQRMI